MAQCQHHEEDSMSHEAHFPYTLSTSEVAYQQEDGGIFMADNSRLDVKEAQNR
jgi:hypothetical protein